MRAVAAQDARLPPEGIGDHAHFFDAGGRPRIKGCSSSHDMLGITSVPAGPGSTEGGDQSGRAALHRFDLREGAVDEQHAARLNTEGVELGDQLGLRNGLLWHGESYHRPHQVEIAVGAKRPPLLTPGEKGEPYGFQSRSCLRGAAGR